MTSTITAVQRPAWRQHDGRPPAAGLARVEWSIEETLHLAYEVDQEHVYELLTAFAPGMTREVRAQVEQLLELAGEIADCQHVIGAGMRRQAAVDEYAGVLRGLARTLALRLVR